MAEAKAKKNTGLIAGIVGGAVALIAIVVVVIIVIANSAKGGLVGTWKLTSASVGGFELSGELLEQAGMNGSEIEFKSDGTGVMRLKGQEDGDSSFKYDNDKKTLTADGQTVDIKVDGNKITIEMPNEMGKMVFEK